MLTGWSSTLERLLRRLVRLYGWAELSRFIRIRCFSDNPSVKTVDVLDGSQQVRICGRVVYGWNGRRL